MRPELVTGIPGPRSKALMSELSRTESRNITFFNDGFPVFWERALGVNVWDADGNRFLDLTAGFGVCSLGHGATREALIEQAGRLVHGLGDVHPSPLKARLCSELSRVTFERWGRGPGKSILCNSGSEAVEAALKTAHLHSGKPGVISFSGAYHGLGHGALETGGLPFFRDPFAGQLAKFGTRLPFPDCTHCPFGCREGFRLEGREFPNCSSSCLAELHDRIEKTIRQREVGCILVEPIQGRAGVIVPPRDFLRMLREICDTHKILLVLDEIFTGLNRTGKLFACEHSETAPDVICVGKALTNGFPMSACIGRADIMDAWPRSDGEALHTSTFLGHPVGCAMALAALAEHEKPATAQLAKTCGAHLRKAVAHLPRASVRGVGAMIGAELSKPDGTPDAPRTARLIQHALERGHIFLGGGPAGNVLTFSPPFTFSEDDAECLAEILASGEE
ncbi:MAG: aminotransferase class III-fold pyridoxal phosphate-dependent enzyme [Terrimicrobiaceae bacterium]|nr:aminotransferase class III-fold pyridoxal phosphate-dependent enzyme [Terrimicrobiaceae bacterium]